MTTRNWRWRDAWGDKDGRIHAVRLADSEGRSILESSDCPRSDLVMAEEHAHLISAAPELYEALREVEWSGCDGGTRLFCPSCERHSDGKDHADDCIVGAALAKASGVEEERR